MRQATALDFAQRRASPKLARVVMWTLWVLLVGHAAQSTAALGQVRPTFPQPIGQPVGGGIDSDIPSASPADNEKLLKTLNADRQKSLVSDTNKLLRLVNELNAEIARTAPDSLSDAELRKLAMIEKLAHNVKDKMSTSVRGTPAFRPPPFPRE
jgi:hypothetical protein